MDEYAFDLLLMKTPMFGHHPSLGDTKKAGWLKIMERSLLDDEYVINKWMDAYAEPVGVLFLKHIFPVIRVPALVP